MNPVAHFLFGALFATCLLAFGVELPRRRQGLGSSSLGTLRMLLVILLLAGLAAVPQGSRYIGDRKLDTGPIFNLFLFHDVWDLASHRFRLGDGFLDPPVILFGLAFGVALLIYTDPNFDRELAVPFFKNFTPHLGWVYVPLAALVIVAASNAVNLTDGLDGLAIGPVMIAAGTFLILAYAAGHSVIADYLAIKYVAGSGQLAIFCGALVGGGLGFLWFNTYPAQLFMGDVGSLALGGALGAIAIVIRQEILLAVVGGIFVVETLSVMIQVISFKLTGKRVFLMAPIHHHFEQMGWAEQKIVVRFWIVAIILALVALSSLKLR